MAGMARQGWRRVKTSVAGEVEVVLRSPIDEVRAETERISSAVKELRQVTDRIAATVGAITSGLAALQGDARAHTEATVAHADVSDQTTELFGRLLQALTSRVEVLEDHFEHVPVGQAPVGRAPVGRAT